MSLPGSRRSPASPVFYSCASALREVQRSHLAAGVSRKNTSSAAEIAAFPRGTPADNQHACAASSPVAVRQRVSDSSWRLDWHRITAGPIVAQRARQRPQCAQFPSRSGGIEPQFPGIEEVSTVRIQANRSEALVAVTGADRHALAALGAAARQYGLPRLGLHAGPRKPCVLARWRRLG